MIDLGSSAARVFTSALKTETNNGITLVHGMDEGIFEYFFGRPLAAVFKKNSYILKPVEAGAVVLNPALRIDTLEPRHTGQASNGQDGIYRAAAGGPPALIVTEGNIFSMESVVSGKTSIADFAEYSQ